ncbi:MAG: transcriptional regulator [Desulfobacterales bacterium]|nr:MAG: transcriptional regulator [Desulfobacterales bacterium]
MPVYEYECPACEKVFEVQQKMTDSPVKTCFDCGGPVKKLISQSSFQLKGGGWYADGYSGSSGGCKKSSSSAGKSSTPPCQSGDSCASCSAASS